MAKSRNRSARVIDEFGKLPGIGRKSAERLAYHLLRVHKAEALGLADAIRDVRENVHYCRACFNLAEGELCAICSDPKRDQTQLCIVEQPRDLMALEQAGVYRGLYHVLLGRIAPLDGIGPDQLTIDRAGRRACGQVASARSSWPPTRPSKGTERPCTSPICWRNYPVQVTRLARGITTGSVLEYTNKEVLADALTGRQRF